ncbi:hypothetical protein DFH08DRAFT_970678 [Mycena albidolilacea]|uniref:Uncharacterized protein n=1 Tax=Mycena albidolilacea TaxID=1033008 RepID=A0AAD6ZEH7_9AGAR|nr:hypothetical protein DFH08DRAFT_970678 [Mycena albidolilacea]
MHFVDSVMEHCLAFTMEVGSQRLVWSAVSKQCHPEMLRSKYINTCERKEPSDFVIGLDSVKAENRLWDKLVNILGKVDPRVTRNIKQYLSAA